MSEALFTFKCPECSHSIEAERRLVGSAIACTGCKQAIKIPSDQVVPPAAPAAEKNPKPPSVELGSTLGGYRLDSRLGKGGMGEVFRATQLAMERDVAVKILSPALTRDPEYVKRFMNEVRLLARLDHPNIVTAIDAGQDSGVWFLAMTFVDGDPLSERVDDGDSIPEREALQITLKVANAMAYAWDKHRLLHRDVKPSNILIDRDGEVKLTDLGVSKSIAERNETGITMTGMVVGTPYYMSPEQARGESDVDFRSDLYALGATLYHLVAGQVPFDGDQPMAIISRVLTDNLVPPRERNPAVSVHTNMIVRVMMARDKEERYQSWEDLIADLRSVLKGRPPANALALSRAMAERASAAPANADGSGERPANTRSMVAMLLLLGVAAITLAALLMFQDSQDSKPMSPEELAKLVPTVGGTAGGAGTDTAVSSSMPSSVVLPPLVMDASATPVGSDSVPVAVVPAGPTETEVRLRALEEMFAYAIAYRDENPDNLDGAIEKFRKVAREAAGTKFKLMAEDEAQSLQRARAESIRELLKGLEGKAARLEKQGKFDEAIAVYRDYRGRWDGATKAQREEAQKAIEATLAEQTAQAEVRRRVAQELVDVLLVDLAGDLLRCDVERPSWRLIEARRDERYEPARDRLEALAARLDVVTTAFARVQNSLKNELEMETELEFRTGKVKMVVKSLTATEIRGMEEVKVGEGTGRILRTFKLADLTLAERMRRLGEADKVNLAMMQALLALQAKRSDLAIELLTGAADDPLPKAMLQLLTQKSEERTEGAAEKDFQELIRLAGLYPKLAETPADLLPALAKKEFSKTDVDPIRRAAAEYLKRYSETRYAEARLAFVKALLAVDSQQWPGNNTDALVVLYDDSRQINRVPDLRGVGTIRVEPKPEGDAKFGRDGQLILDGGAFLLPELEQQVLVACRRSSELTISAWLLPAALDQDGPARIISLSKDAMERDFSLCQERGTIVLRLRTPKTGLNGAAPEVKLCDIPGNDGFYLTVTYKAGVMTTYLNGQKVSESREVDGDFSNWEPHRLLIGNEKSMDRAWRGELRGIAIHARALSAEEAARLWELFSRRLRRLE